MRVAVAKSTALLLLTALALLLCLLCTADAGRDLLDKPPCPRTKCPTGTYCCIPGPIQVNSTQTGNCIPQGYLCLLGK